MKIGFTGTQIGMTPAQQVELVDTLSFYFTKANPKETHEFHHGDCIGADAQAHVLVRSLHPNVRIHLHPPINEKKRAFSKKAYKEWLPLEYLERNIVILHECDALIACPKGPEEPRSGTWFTIRHAMKLGKLLVVIPPKVL